MVASCCCCHVALTRDYIMLVVLTWLCNACCCQILLSRVVVTWIYHVMAFLRFFAGL